MNKLTRQRNYYLSVTILCALLAVSFKFDSMGFTWLWSDRPEIALVLAVLAGIFGFLLLISQQKLHRQQK